MKNETKAFLLGSIAGGVLVSLISTIIVLDIKSETNKQVLGNIIIYPDDFETDQLYLELYCHIDNLKTKKYGIFKIYHDKYNKKVQIKEKYAKS